MFRAVVSLLTLSCASLCFADVTPEVKWGGPGYDPALKKSGSALFRIMASTFKAGAAEIWVDSAKTVEEVGSIELLSPQDSVSSENCWKAMKHINAPWACEFPLKRLAGLTGRGSIVVKDRSGKLLLSEDVDFDLFSQVAAGSK